MTSAQPEANTPEARARGESSRWRTATIVLILVLIFLASFTGYLYSRSPSSGNPALVQPGYVHLLDSRDLDSIMGGNWTGMSAHTLTKASNPSGFFEGGSWMSTQTRILLLLYVNGFNSTSFSDNFYQRMILMDNIYGESNFTRSGVLGGANYTLTGTCSKNGQCSLIEGVGVMSVYVVAISLTLIGGGAEVNATAVMNLLGAQFAEVTLPRESG